jgi:hypothetical protein
MRRLSVLPPSFLLPASMDTVEVFERKPFVAVVDILRALCKPKHAYAMLLCEITIRHSLQRVTADNEERLTQLAAVTARRLIGDCVVARLGTRKFVVLLEGPVDHDDAVLTAGRLHDVMRVPVNFGINEICLNTDIGIGLGEWYVEPDEVLTRSERALDRVRLNGGDHTAVEPPQHPTATGAQRPAAA